MDLDKWTAIAFTNLVMLQKLASLAKHGCPAALASQGSRDFQSV
jgi:hypothetical protein